MLCLGPLHSPSSCLLLIVSESLSMVMYSWRIKKLAASYECNPMPMGLSSTSWSTHGAVSSSRLPTKILGDSYKLVSGFRSLLSAWVIQVHLLPVRCRDSDLESLFCPRLFESAQCVIRTFRRAEMQSASESPYMMSWTRTKLRQRLDSEYGDG